MSIRKIIEIGNPNLKLKNKKISDFRTPELKKLVTDLVDTMKHVDLIGIAAPQIGKNFQIFVTQPRKTQARKLFKGDRLRIYINPKIIYSSKQNVIIYEGCGCIPFSSVFGPVARAKEIKVEAYDLKGRKFSLHCDGILARVIQHEFDHLHGIEFLERVTDNKKLVGWDFYSKHIRNSKSQLKPSKITKAVYQSL